MLPEEYIPRAVLVTGGCGFIGSNFVNYVTSRHESISVINIDRMTYCSRAPDVESPLYKLYKVNLTDAAEVLKILNRHKIDTVVHFAAQTHVDRSFGNSMVFTSDNVKGTHTLLECVRAYGNVKRFIHISTDEVYGEVGDDHEGCKEQSLLNPTNPYAATKASAEFMVRSYGHSFDIPFMITRFNNCYGEYQFPDKLIPKFLNLLMDSKKLPIHGKGDSRRNFIHVQDICSAVWILLRRGQLGEIYNVGSNDEFSVLEIASKLTELVKPGDVVDEHLQYVKDRDFNDYRYCSDTAKLRKLGWSPEVSFEAGLKGVMAWYKNNTSYWECPKTWLVYGARGVIGTKLQKLIMDRGDKCIVITSEPGDVNSVESEVDQHQPDLIVSAVEEAEIFTPAASDSSEARPSTYECLSVNLYAPFVLARVAERKGVHFTRVVSYMQQSLGDKFSTTGVSSPDKVTVSTSTVTKTYADRMSCLLPGMLSCRISLVTDEDTSTYNFHVGNNLSVQKSSGPGANSVPGEPLRWMLQMAVDGETGSVNLSDVSKSTRQM